MEVTRRRAVALLTAGVSAAVGLLPATGKAQRADVWTLKLAFVEKIASFLEWPQDADLTQAESPLFLTFYGDTPMEERARDVYAHRRFGSHAVVVRSVHHPWEIRSSHVLYISASSVAELASILRWVGDMPVLTVADSPGMARRGVAVNLYEEEDRIRFEINRRALHRARIRASFRLLALARIVDEGEP